ncbi:MAG: DNA polymerase/3'-5' exonuclease PolX [Anaerolineales bacterium]|nr:DNA polymerase/3'-5' exonuclease PolX [Anaerolineales bacterium]
MNNQELAQVFANIGDLLEIKGEVIYKILAYRRAAETLREYGRDVRAVWQEGKLREIPSVGAAIAEKIDELLRTGRLEFYEKLKAEIPPGLIEILAVPDLGPKKAAMFWKQRNITSLAALAAAARAGQLRELPGMGEKSEAKILAGIELLARRASGRRPLGQVWTLAQEILVFLRGLPGVQQAEAAGSLRRHRSTIGDLDFLAAADDAGPIMEAFCQHPSVARVLGHGPTKSSVEFVNGLQADLRVLPKARFGTLLQYFTGSKDHNVKLRERALRQGLSLSEYALTRESGAEILCAAEEEVYRRLGLEYIPPELREDRGEIEAAAKGTLPKLIELGDLRSDLHAHSTWSDGRLSLLEMARGAQARGLRCLAITDHSQSLGVTGGLTPERLRAQRAEIDQAQRALGRGFTLLQGSEVEIRGDGRLDYDDDVLASLDVVVASAHSTLRQPREQITARLIRAIESPHVDIIGHPTGRLFPDREGADLDMEAVLRAAAQAGVALEINANPARLDLDDGYAYRALELGCLLAINTDAHHTADFDLAHFGVGIARRAWARPEQVISTWPPERLRQWLAGRGQGGSAPAVMTDATKAARPVKKAPAKKAPKMASKQARKPASKKPTRTAAKRRPGTRPGRRQSQ